MNAVAVTSFIVIPILLLFVVMRGVYPAVVRAKHKINTPNGIDQMEMVEIGGIKQALYFRGMNKDNPAVLYLHGGPGSATIPVLHTFQCDWEQDFTIVQWDQRNTGKTFAANDPDVVRDTLTADRALADAHEATRYIKSKLNKDKIVVLGQSWGSILGTMLVQTYPEDYSMYIGTGQAINSADGERIGYEKAMDAARMANNQKDVDALMALAPYPPKIFDKRVFRQAMTVRKFQSKYNLAVSADLNVMLLFLTTPYYTTSEMLSAIKGMINPEYHGDIWRFLFEEYDAHSYGIEYQVPVYYLQGENDWQTPYPVAKAFFENITAPDKKFFSIPDAGHMTNIDNKTEFTRVLLKEIRPIIDK